MDHLHIMVFPELYLMINPPIHNSLVLLLRSNPIWDGLQRSQPLLLSSPLLASLSSSENNRLGSKVCEEEFTNDLDQVASCKVDDHGGCELEHKL